MGVRGANNQWPLHSWQGAPPRAGAGFHKPFLFLRSPSSAPVTHLSGRRRQGQRQPRWINTLFLGVQLASVKCESAAPRGRPFCCETGISTAPPPGVPHPPTFCGGRTLKLPSGKFLKFLGMRRGLERKEDTARPDLHWSLLSAMKPLDLASDFFFSYRIASLALGQCGLTLGARGVR